MMTCYYTSAKRIVMGRVWVFPYFLLSLLVGAQFTQKTMLVRASFCRYLAAPFSRDEVKGIYPIAYEEKNTEAILVILLFAICLSIDVCWTGGWRCLRLQPWWFALQSDWIRARLLTTTLFKGEMRRLSNDGLNPQAKIRLYLASMHESFSLLVHDVFVAWPCMFFLGVTLFSGLYLLRTVIVKGPCLKAPVRQDKMTAPSLKLTPRAWLFILFVRLSCLLFFSSFLSMCVTMDRALRHLLGRSDCLDLSKTIQRPFAVLFGHLCLVLWMSSLVYWFFWSLKRHMLLASEAYWLYLINYSK